MEMEGTEPKFRSLMLVHCAWLSPGAGDESQGSALESKAPARVIGRHPSEVTGMLGSQIQATPLSSTSPASTFL